MQTVFVNELNGPLDARTPIEKIAPTAFRWRQNFFMDANGRIKRVPGFIPAYRRLPCAYDRNFDLHDRGDPPDATNIPPITFLFHCRSNDGFYHLFAGTKHRIWKINEQTGQWTPIFGDQVFGQDGYPNHHVSLRWRAALVNDVVVFTNGFDPPRYYKLSDGTNGTIDSLSTAGVDPGGNEGVPVTKAQVVIAWRGVMFFMNTVEGGAAFRSRIRWSDLNNPLEWRPRFGDSIADWQDLDHDEEILNATVLAGYLYVFTDRSIWRCNLGAGAEEGSVGMSAVKVYSEPRNRFRCLAYPHTLVSDGFNAYYLGWDTIYVYNPQEPAPTSPDWVHGASAAIFDRFPVDRNAFISPIAELTFAGTDVKNVRTPELHISWPTRQRTYFVVGSEGIDACSLDPEHVRLTWPRGYGLNNHTLVLNLAYQTSDYRDYGMLAYANHVWDARREGESLVGNDFFGGSMFLGASSVDGCIKEMYSDYARWFYDRQSDSYYSVNYESILRGVIPFGVAENEVMVARVRIRGEPDDESDATPAHLRIGAAGAPYDPNDTSGRCRVVWHQLTPKAINCRRRHAPDGMRSASVRQKVGAELDWASYIRGRYLYYELRIGGTGRGQLCAGCKGGGFAITSIEFVGRRA